MSLVIKTVATLVIGIEAMADVIRILGCLRKERRGKRKMKETVFQSAFCHHDKTL